MRSSYVSTITSSLQGVRAQEVDTSTLMIGVVQGILQGNYLSDDDSLLDSRLSYFILSSSCSLSNKLNLFSKFSYLEINEAWSFSLALRALISLFCLVRCSC